MKVVYKYRTGQEVPRGAKYLYSKEEEVSYSHDNHHPSSVSNKIGSEILIWHYFLVEVFDET